MEMRFFYKGNVTLYLIAEDGQYTYLDNSHNDGTSYMQKMFGRHLFGYFTNDDKPYYLQLADNLGPITDNIPIISKKIKNERAQIIGKISKQNVYRDSNTRISIHLKSKDNNSLAIYKTNLTIDTLISTGSSLGVTWELFIYCPINDSDSILINGKKLNSIFGDAIVYNSTDLSNTIRDAYLNGIPILISNKTIYLDIFGNYFMQCLVVIDEIDKKAIRNALNTDKINFYIAIGDTERLFDFGTISWGDNIDQIHSTGISIIKINIRLEI